MRSGTNGRRVAVSDRGRQGGRRRRWRWWRRRRRWRRWRRWRRRNRCRRRWRESSGITGIEPGPTVDAATGKGSDERVGPTAGTGAGRSPIGVGGGLVSLRSPARTSVRPRQLVVAEACCAARSLDGSPLLHQCVVVLRLVVGGVADRAARLGDRQRRQQQDDRSEPEVSGEAAELEVRHRLGRVRQRHEALCVHEQDDGVYDTSSGSACVGRRPNRPLRSSRKNGT